MQEHLINILFLAEILLEEFIKGDITAWGTSCIHPQWHIQEFEEGGQKILYGKFRGKGGFL